MWAEQFPTEFAKLTDVQARLVERTLASHALEGLVPDRMFVASLVAIGTGEIDRAEYGRRGRQWAALRRENRSPDLAS